MLQQRGELSQSHQWSQSCPDQARGPSWPHWGERGAGAAIELGLGPCKVSQLFTGGHSEPSVDAQHETLGLSFPALPPQ